MCAVAALVENKWLGEESRRAVMGANIPPIFCRNGSIISVCGDGVEKEDGGCSYTSASEASDLYITGV